MLRIHKKVIFWGVKIDSEKEITPLIRQRKVKQAYEKFKKLCNLHRQNPRNFTDFTVFLRHNLDEITQQRNKNRQEICEEILENGCFLCLCRI